MKRTLLTGASGFVGANLARRLLRDQHEVLLLLRDRHQTWRIEDIVKDCSITIADTTDREAVRRCLLSAKPNWVFHLSAYGAYPNQTGFEQMVATNLIGSANLLDACIESGAESFVQTGSSSEYGYTSGAAREDDRIAPNSHYAISKAAATHYCQFTARKLNFHAVTARLYSVYGPYEEPTRLIPTLIVHALDGKLPPLVSPETARDFVYVEDVVDALIRLASHQSASPGVIYNVCTGVQSSLAQVVELTRTLLEVRASPKWGTMPRRTWDADIWFGDPGALRDHLGWTAETSLGDGLVRMTRWLLDNPRWLTFYSNRILHRAD